MWLGVKHVFIFRPETGLHTHPLLFVHWLFLVRLWLVYLDQSKEQCSVKTQQSANLCLSVDLAVSFLAVRIIMNQFFELKKTTRNYIKCRLWEDYKTSQTLKEVKPDLTVDLKDEWAVFLGFCKTNTHSISPWRTLNHPPCLKSHASTPCNKHIKGYEDHRSQRERQRERAHICTQLKASTHNSKSKPMRVAVKAGMVPALWLPDKPHKHSFESQWTTNALLCTHDRAAHCDH